MTEVLDQTAQSRLKSFLERIERLEDDKAGVMADIKEVYGELGAEGFDKKIVRQVVKLLRMDRAKRQEAEAILDLYMSALGEA